MRRNLARLTFCFSDALTFSSGSSHFRKETDCNCDLSKLRAARCDVAEQNLIIIIASLALCRYKRTHNPLQASQPNSPRMNIKILSLGATELLSSSRILQPDYMPSSEFLLFCTLSSSRRHFLCTRTGTNSSLR